MARIRCKIVTMGASNGPKGRSRFSPPSRPDELEQELESEPSPHSEEQTVSSSQTPPQSSEEPSPDVGRPDPVEVLFDTLQAEQLKQQRFRHNFQSEPNERAGNESLVDRYSDWVPRRSFAVICAALLFITLSGWALLTSINSNKDSLKSELKNEIKSVAKDLGSSKVERPKAKAASSSSRRSEVRYTKDRVQSTVTPSRARESRNSQYREERNSAEAAYPNPGQLSGSRFNPNKNRRNKIPPSEELNDNFDEGGQKINSDTSFDRPGEEAPEAAPVGAESDYVGDYEDTPQTPYNGGYNNDDYQENDAPVNPNPEYYNESGDAPANDDYID